MNVSTDDWKGEHLIRAPKREQVPFEMKTIDEQRVQRRMRIATNPSHDALAERLRGYAANNLTMGEAANLEGVTHSWVCELAKFRGINFITLAAKRRLGRTT